MSRGLGISDVSGLIEEWCTGRGFPGRWDLKKGQDLDWVSRGGGLAKNKDQEGLPWLLYWENLRDVPTWGMVAQPQPGQLLACVASSRLFSLSVPIFKMGVIHVSLSYGCMESFRIRTHTGLSKPSRPIKVSLHFQGLPWWLDSTESACQCKRHGFSLWVRKIPWRRKWQPTPVFLPGKSHGQRSLAASSLWGCKEQDMS